MILLAVIAVSIFALESSPILSPGTIKILQRVDMFILIIFVADYVIRLMLAERKDRFVRSNMPELIAILPFSSVFRIARLARLTRLTRVSRVFARIPRLVRVMSYGRIVLKKVNVFLHTNGLIYAIYVTTVFVVLGAGLINLFEDSIETFGDALWWSFVTATTVGYGDISPSTGAGRLVAVGLMLTGIGLIGMVTGTVATYFLGSKSERTLSTQKLLIEELKSQLDKLDGLSDRDVSTICSTIQSLHRERYSEVAAAYEHDDKKDGGSNIKGSGTINVELDETEEDFRRSQAKS